MAEYLIQDTSLEAIADAINAKTGGSSAMTPAEMAAAIGSISGGGGGDLSYHLLYDETLSEEVDTIKIDFINAWQEYKVIYVLVDSPANSPTYPYVRVNSLTSGGYVGAAALSNAAIVPIPGTEGEGQVSQFPYTRFVYPIQYIYFAKYYADAKFRIGTRIRLYGWG